MRITDGHIHHIDSPTDPAHVLRAMDANGIDRIIVLSPEERTSLERTRAAMLHTSRLAAAAPDRITALARVNPTVPGMMDLAREGLCEMGFTGLKMLPDHWYPCDESLEPFWAAMNELDARILFHTGILYAHGDSSRFCRPVYLEKLLHYPRIRFAMAHISWPWCEECLAVMGRMRAAAGWEDPQGWQSYIDITPGTPPHIRKQALANAIEFCGADRIMWGSDDGVPGKLPRQKEFLLNDMGIFNELGLSKEQKARILSGTADELFPART